MLSHVSPSYFIAMHSPYRYIEPVLIRCPESPIPYLYRAFLDALSFSYTALVSCAPVTGTLPLSPCNHTCERNLSWCWWAAPTDRFKREVQSNLTSWTQPHHMKTVVRVSGIEMAARIQTFDETLMCPWSSVLTNCVEKKFWYQKSQYLVSEEDCMEENSGKLTATIDVGR